MEIFANLVTGCKSLIVFAKEPILDVWLGSEYASAFDVNVTKFMKTILKPLAQTSLPYFLKPKLFLV